MTYKAQMKPITIIQKLDVAKSKRSQEKIIQDAWNSDSEDFFLGLEIALDPNMNFNLSTVPEIQDNDDGSEGDFTFKEFYLLAKQLANGQISGDASKKLLIDAAMKANISEWNLWYRRILLKTLPNYLPMDIIKNSLLKLTSQ